jgi:hypothetical protein
VANFCADLKNGKTPQPGSRCWSNVLGNGYRLRSHELMHNFAIHHSNGNAAEYGNPTDIMGQGNVFSHASRYTAKWIDEHHGGFFSNAEDKPMMVPLTALDHGLSSGYGRYHAIISDCKLCRTPGGKVKGDWQADGPPSSGGVILLGYRGDVNLEGAVTDQWKTNKVEVMFQLYPTKYGSGKMSALWAALSEGDSYYVRFSGFAVHVCKADSVNEATVGIAYDPVRSVAVDKAAKACPNYQPPVPALPVPSGGSCGCDTVVMSAPAGTSSFWAFGAAWKRISDTVWTMGMSNPYTSSWPSTRRSTSAEPAFLMLCSDQWKIFKKKQSCKAGEFYTVAKSAVDGAATCPTLASGWSVKQTGSSYEAMSVSTSCGCTCDHFSIAGGEGSSPMAMTLYTKSGAHNSRPTFKSANDKYLYFDGARWRVADSSFPASGGDVQSAASNTACPNEGSGWEVYHPLPGSSDGAWLDTGVSVYCDCTCSQLKLSAEGYHKPGVVSGSTDWELSGKGDMGRPIYSSYDGEKIMYSEELSAWFTGASPDADGNQVNRWFGLSTHTSGSLAFCPADIAPSMWIYDKSVSAECTCLCNQVQIAVKLSDAVSAAGIFEIVSGVTAYSRPVFKTPAGMYLYYYGPELRWLVGSSYSSADGVVVRSAITSGYCPITQSTAWYAKQADGTWRADDVVEATCVPYSYTPPAPPPPMPPFETLCDCPMYELKSSYSASWQMRIFNDITFVVMGEGDREEHNGGRPVMKSTKRIWSNVAAYFLFYSESEGRWRIASKNSPWYGSARSAPSTATCADKSTGWEIPGAVRGEWTPIGTTITFTCEQHSPPAAPPTLVPSSMITCLPQMTQDACTYFAKQQGRTFPKDSMVCFGVAAGGFDACDKDEGGPLVVHGNYGKMVQVGIASRVGCGAANVPTEYTKIAKFKDWIIARITDDKLKCMHTCPVDGCTNVAFPGARTCRGPCQICNSFGWG